MNSNKGRLYIVCHVYLPMTVVVYGFKLLKHVHMFGLISKHNILYINNLIKYV